METKNKKIGLKILLVLIVFSILILGTASAYSRSTSANYLSGQGISLFPLNNAGEICTPGQDFLVQIAPLGCSPTVVRSDLLEEQNVPVFCQLSATQINPLIDVGAIESVHFTGEIPEDVSGIGFHPSQAALKNSRSTLLNSPALNNIGYVVVVLKQHDTEAEMPDFVEGNLTARLKYDVNNAFGVGTATMYLPELSGEEWDNSHNLYGFWKQRGFLRAEKINDDSATIGLYVDADQRVRTTNLNIGETSEIVSLPGANFCSAGLKIRLDGLENPDTFADLRINGDSVNVQENQKFLENRCNVVNLEKTGIVQRATISCRTDDGTERFELLISPSIKIDFGEGQEKFVIGDKLFEAEGISYYVANIGSLKKDSTDIKDVFIYVVGKNGELTDSDLRRASSVSRTVNQNNPGENFVLFGKDNTIGGKNIKLIGYSLAVDESSGSEIDEKFRESYGSSLGDYQILSEDYPYLKTESGLQNYGEVALKEAIDLARRTSQGNDVFELCQEFEALYGFEKLPLECKDSYLISNEGIASKSVVINGLVKTISLERISEPRLSDFGATIEIRGPNGKVETVTLGKDQVLTLDDFRDGDSEIANRNEFIQLTSLNVNGSARLQMSISPRAYGATGFNSVSGTRVLNEGVVESFGSDYNFVLIESNLKKQARVSILPEVQNRGAEANFSFKIHIEKRSIELSPEKIEKRLESVEDQIAVWGNVSEGLGDVVKGFKAACLSTGTYLTVKNLFENAGGKSLARQEVMRGDGGWVDRCKIEIATTGDSLDSCLLEYNDDIEKDVETLHKIIENQGDGITEENFGERLTQTRDRLGDSFEDPYGRLEPVSIGKDSDVYASLSVRNYSASQINLRESRDLERWSLILEDPQSSEQLKQVARRNLYSELTGIQKNADLLSNRNSFANSFNSAAEKVNHLADPDSTVLVYHGLTTSDLPSGTDPRIKGSGAPIGAITTNEGNYFVLLDDPVNEGKMSLRSQEGNLFVLDESGNLLTNVPEELENIYYQKIDSTSYNNKFTVEPEVRYFETAPYKGMPSLVPFDVKKGFYVSVQQTVSVFGNIRSYDDSGAPSSFMICNVGANGIPQSESGFGDDTCTGFNPGTGQIYGTFPGMDERETESLVKQASDALREASNQYSAGVTKVRINGEIIKVGNPSANVPKIQCQDFMSPADCNLFFNVCDPVICPSSRCDLGGEYPVDNVIQSGIVGSIAMCLPNAGEVAVPICVSGVKAGVDSLLDGYKLYQDCLEKQLETGEVVGICDEIQSIYMCEFFWRQSVPVVRAGVPFLVNSLSGNSNHGGGEYLGFQDAWQNAESSVDYMVGYYGANSLNAFRARSTEEAGGSICRAFVSARYPSSVDFLDNILEPDSPTQFYAQFDEIPFTTATVPPTSQYKVFYMISGGKDSGVYYRVYLKSPEGSSFFQSTPTYTVASGYIPRGDRASETIDFTATSGYKELCVNINGKEECGFKKVTTSFASNYVDDLFREQQATQKDVSSEAECVSGSPSLYSFVNPNVQEGGDNFLNPELYNQGIVRVCSTENPGRGTNPERWEKVGTCDGQVGKVSCYVDLDSVKDAIEFKSIENRTLNEIGRDLDEINEKYLGKAEFDSSVDRVEAEKNNLEKIKIINEVIGKVFWDYEKAKLILLRGNAWKQVALVDYENVKVESISVPKNNENLPDCSGITDPRVCNDFTEEFCWYDEYAEKCIDTEYFTGEKSSDASGDFGSNEDGWDFASEAGNNLPLVWMNGDKIIVYNSIDKSSWISYELQSDLLTTGYYVLETKSSGEKTTRIVERSFLNEQYLKPNREFIPSPSRSTGASGDFGSNEDGWEDSSWLFSLLDYIDSTSRVELSQATNEQKSALEASLRQRSFQGGVEKIENSAGGLRVDYVGEKYDVYDLSGTIVDSSFKSPSLVFDTLGPFNTKYRYYGDQWQVLSGFIDLSGSRKWKSLSMASVRDPLFEEELRGSDYLNGLDVILSNILSKGDEFYVEERDVSVAGQTVSNTILFTYSPKGYSPVSFRFNPSNDEWTWAINLGKFNYREISVSKSFSSNDLRDAQIIASSQDVAKRLNGVDLSRGAELIFT